MDSVEPNSSVRFIGVPDGGGSEGRKLTSRRSIRKSMKGRKSRQSTLRLMDGKSLITNENFTVSATKALFGADFTMGKFREDYLDTDGDLEGLSQELKRRKVTCENTLQEVLAGSESHHRLAHFCHDARTLEKEVQYVSEALVGFQDMLEDLKKTSFGFSDIIASTTLMKAKSWDEKRKEEEEKEIALDRIIRFQNDWKMGLENQKFRACLLYLREAKRGVYNEDVDTKQMQSELVQALEDDITDMNTSRIMPDLFAMLVQTHGSIHHAAGLFFSVASSRLKRCAHDILPQGDRLPYLKQYLNAFVDQMKNIMSEFQLFAVEINTLGLDILLEEASSMDGIPAANLDRLKNLIMKFKKGQPSQPKDISFMKKENSVKTFVQEILNEDFLELETETVFFAPLVKTQSLLVVWACRQVELLLQFFQHHVFTAKDKGEIQQCMSAALLEVEKLSEIGLDLKTYLKLKLDLEFDTLKLESDKIIRVLDTAFASETWENKPIGKLPFTKSGHVLIEQIDTFLEILSKMKKSGVKLPQVDARANLREFVEKYCRLAVTSTSTSDLEFSQYVVMLGSLHAISETVLLKVQSKLSTLFSEAYVLDPEKNSIKKCEEIIRKRCGRLFARKWGASYVKVSSTVPKDSAEDDSDNEQLQATREMQIVLKRIHESYELVWKNISQREVSMNSSPFWIQSIFKSILSSMAQDFINRFADRNLDALPIAFDLNLFYMLFSFLLEKDCSYAFQARLLFNLTEIDVPPSAMQSYTMFTK